MMRAELTAKEVKDALTRLADGLMLEPINRIELRAIAVMLMNDADAVVTARYLPTEEDAAKLLRLGDEVVSLRMQLNEARVKAEGHATRAEIMRYQDKLGALQQIVEERDSALTRIDVIMGTMRTHFRNAETRRREIMELVSEVRSRAKEEA